MASFMGFNAVGLTKLIYGENIVSFKSKFKFQNLVFRSNGYMYVNKVQNRVANILFYVYCK